MLDIGKFLGTTEWGEVDWCKTSNIMKTAFTERCKIFLAVCLPLIG